MTEESPKKGRVKKERTPKAQSKPSQGLSLAMFSLIFSLLAPLYLVIVMLAVAGGNLDYDLGFKTLTLDYGPKMSVIALAVCVLILLVSIFKDPSRSGLLAFVAVVIAGGLFGGFYWYGEALKTHPPISDVATDWSRPVTLSNALVKARGPTALTAFDDPVVPATASIKWTRKRISDINAETCPGAKPILHHLDEAPVRKVLEELGYTITGGSPWRIEALYTDPFYGFESDMIIRLDPDRTDARSISRLQEADLGGNCERVTKVMAALAKIDTK